MKIKVENYMGLMLHKLLEENPNLYREIFGKGLVKTFMNDPDYVIHFTSEQLDHRQRIINEFIYKSDFKIFLVTQKAGENEILKIKNPTKGIKLLDNIPVKRGIFIMNKKELFKYFFEKDQLYFLWLMLDDNMYVTYSAFHIDITTGTIGGVTNDDLKWTMENFLRTLIYTFYSKNDFVFLKPREKHRGKSYDDHILNDSKYPVTVIDSFWNKTIIRLQGFSVSGHFRFQACGKGHKDRRLQWIDEFKKEHYIRRAAKQTQKL